ncbi:hypothetical protein BJX66DRAFT_306166, partial [Aspergillus keveii]
MVLSPLSAARDNAVSPLNVLASRSAPWLVNSSTTLPCPLFAARSRGVQPTRLCVS